LLFKQGRTTLSAAVLIAAAPTVLARNAPHQHRHVFKKRPQFVHGYAPWRVMHTNGVTTGYAASGFAPSAPKDYTYDNSRNAGGGGGGGGSGM
jgi:hypothetical protein